MALLQLARRFNNYYLSLIESEGQTELTPLLVKGQRIGMITPCIAKHLHPPLFMYTESGIELNPNLDCEALTLQIDELLRDWRKKDLFVTLRGWRNETFDVRSTLDEPPLLRMERSATCLFGIRQYGVSINGYVRHPHLGLCIWLGRRSSSKQTWPGLLDNFVGGGLASGYSVLDTAWKEGREEAGLSKELLQGLKGAGSVSFFFSSERGLFPNTEFVYDLELPLNYLPINQDGEVDEFRLVTAAEAYALIQTEGFKTTSCPVVLDFLIRRGVLNVGEEPDLPQVIELLHVPLHTIYSSNGSS